MDDDTEWASGNIAVSLSGVAKEYRTRSGPVLALQQLDLDVFSGQFVAMLGPSGCGKSTALNIVAGLAAPTRGEVHVLGKQVRRPVTEVGIVFQSDLLLRWRNSLRNVLLQVEMRGLRPADYREHARELLEVVGLKGFEDKMPRELSGGMRQRVAICRALIHDPPLLLMDEPFGALDAMTRDQMNLDIQRLWDHSSQTVLFVTHSIAEAVFLADRVIVMSPRPGQVVKEFDIELPRPRHLAIRESEEFNLYTREIRMLFQSMGLFREQPGETK